MAAPPQQQQPPPKGPNVCQFRMPVDGRVGADITPVLEALGIPGNPERAVQTARDLWQTVEGVKTATGATGANAILDGVNTLIGARAALTTQLEELRSHYDLAYGNVGKLLKAIGKGGNVDSAVESVTEAMEAIQEVEKIMHAKSPENALAAVKKVTEERTQCMGEIERLRTTLSANGKAAAELQAILKTAQAKDAADLHNKIQTMSRVTKTEGLDGAIGATEAAINYRGETEGRIQELQREIETTNGKHDSFVGGVMRLAYGEGAMGEHSPEGAMAMLVEMRKQLEEVWTTMGVGNQEEAISFITDCQHRIEKYQKEVGRLKADKIRRDLEAKARKAKHARALREAEADCADKLNQLTDTAKDSVGRLQAAVKERDALIMDLGTKLKPGATLTLPDPVTLEDNPEPQGVFAPPVRDESMHGPEEADDDTPVFDEFMNAAIKVATEHTIDASELVVNKFINVETQGTVNMDYLEQLASIGDETTAPSDLEQIIPSKNKRRRFWREVYTHVCSIQKLRDKHAEIIQTIVSTNPEEFNQDYVPVAGPLGLTEHWKILQQSVSVLGENPRLNDWIKEYGRLVAIVAKCLSESRVNEGDLRGYKLQYYKYITDQMRNRAVGPSAALLNIDVIPISIAVNVLENMGGTETASKGAFWPRFFQVYSMGIQTMAELSDWINFLKAIQHTLVLRNLRVTSIGLKNINVTSVKAYIHAMEQIAVQCKTKNTAVGKLPKNWQASEEYTVPFSLPGTDKKTPASLDTIASALYRYLVDQQAQIRSCTNGKVCNIWEEMSSPDMEDDKNYTLRPLFDILPAQGDLSEWYQTDPAVADLTSVWGFVYDIRYRKDSDDPHLGDVTLEYLHMVAIDEYQKLIETSKTVHNVCGPEITEVCQKILEQYMGKLQRLRDDHEHITKDVDVLVATCALDKIGCLLSFFEELLHPGITVMLYKQLVTTLVKSDRKWRPIHDGTVVGIDDDIDGEIYWASATLKTKKALRAGAMLVHENGADIYGSIDIPGANFDFVRAWDVGYGEDNKTWRAEFWGFMVWQYATLIMDYYLDSRVCGMYSVYFVTIPLWYRANNKELPKDVISILSRIHDVLKRVVELHDDDEVSIEIDPNVPIASHRLPDGNPAFAEHFTKSLNGYMVELMETVMSTSTIAIAYPGIGLSSFNDVINFYCDNIRKRQRDVASLDYKLKPSGELLNWVLPMVDHSGSDMEEEEDDDEMIDVEGASEVAKGAAEVAKAPQGGAAEGDVLALQQLDAQDRKRMKEAYSEGSDYMADSDTDEGDSDYMADSDTDEGDSDDMANSDADVGGY